MKPIQFATLLVSATLTATAMAQPPQGGPGGGFGGGFGGGEGFRIPNPLLMALDKDKDGKLKGDEIPPFMRERFEQNDSNKDGSLDKSELEVGMARMREGRGGEVDRGRDGGRGQKASRSSRPAAEDDSDDAPKKDIDNK